VKYYIGVDLGTSALKLLLVDSCGNIVNTVSRSYPVSFPKPMYSEQEYLQSILNEVMFK